MSHEAIPIDPLTQAARTVRVDKQPDVMEYAFNAASSGSTKYASCVGFDGCDMQIVGTDFTLTVARSQNIDEEDITSADYTGGDKTVLIGGAASITASDDFTDDAGIFRNSYMKFVATVSSGTLTVRLTKRGQR